MINKVKNVLCFIVFLLRMPVAKTRPGNEKFRFAGITR